MAAHASTMMHQFLLAIVVILACWSCHCLAWTTPFALRRPCYSQLYSSSTTSVAGDALTTTDEDEEEWEYLEYEDLEESDFLGSEWLVGTNWDKSRQKIEETWVRCLVDEDSGKTKCVWGDGSKGTWSFDRASQYFSLSKENWLGKTIWAGVVEDYYYLQGTVRGWTYLTPAEVLGQWQAKRLGVTKEEAGTAPWFETDKDEEEERKEEDDKESSSDIETKEEKDS